MKGAAFRKSQISALTDSYSNYSHVIICGDFNVSQESELSPFIQTGFTLANSSSNNILYTYPAENPSQAIDNIIVKGFTIDRVDTVNDMRLSDHSLLRAILVFQ